MSRSKLKAGHTRWYATADEIFTLQVVARKYKRTGKVGWLVRDGMPSDYVYAESTILRNTYPTYRKAQRSVVQYMH